MSRIIKSSLVIENTEKKDLKKDMSLKKDSLENQILDDANEKAEKIIKKANEKAEKIINNAKEESENILIKTHSKKDEIIDEYRDKGYEEGYKRGYEEGYEEGKSESTSLIDEAVKIKENNINSKKEIIDKLEKDIITVVMKSCKKIINRLYDEDKEIILSIIQKGLDDLNNPSKLTIKVSKYDYDFLEMYKDKISVMISSIEKIDVVIDKALDKGGIIIETPKGSVDVSINTQIEELEKFLEDLLNSE
ncbi:hypothetical protein GOQ29_10555 [Clostridium sp. D2Q-14]|uniref:FliH/SctL family protein n=1 Tax=Anaeromonas gelatinilytica TaxID=2683194 RepID=UPI00193C5E2C|nr:FliH/SctL family protein [Anaeromonas gelatinilytica]MBS4536054.1 hypothetical protein [Anaeromonas gelatinilytica]